MCNNVNLKVQNKKKTVNVEKDKLPIAYFVYNITSKNKNRYFERNYIETLLREKKNQSVKILKIVYFQMYI